MRARQRARAATNGSLAGGAAGGTGVALGAGGAGALGGVEWVALGTHAMPTGVGKHDESGLQSESARQPPQREFKQ